MTTFNSNSQENLQYDDTAFNYFLITIIIPIIIFLIFSIISQIYSSLKQNKNLNKLQQTNIFLKQLQKQKLQSKYLTNKIIIKSIITLILFIICLIIFTNLQNSSQILNFNPYDNLHITSSASQKEIKKAFRKLSLKWHPDRNMNSPESKIKFILISLSYQCLQNQSNRINCQKYGNVEGINLKKISIGLPSFIITSQYQFIILPIILSIILIAMPYLFMYWNNRLRNNDRNAINIQLYYKLYLCLQSNFPNYHSLIFMAILSANNRKNKQKIILKENQKQIIRKQLKESFNISSQLIQKLNAKQLRTVKDILNHLKGCKIQNLSFLKQVPYLFHQMIKFCQQFTTNHKYTQFLLNNQNWPIIQYDYQLIVKLIENLRKFYHCSNRQLYGLDQLELSQQDLLIYHKNPINNIKQLIQSEKLKQYLSQFNNKQFIEKQIINLPIIELSIKFKVENNQISNQVPLNYHTIIEVIVKKNNRNYNYCSLKNYPFLKKQIFYLLIIRRNKIIFLQSIEFNQNSQQQNIFKGEINFRKKKPGKVIITALLMSDCYYGLDQKKKININFIEPIKENEKNIVINQKDLDIEKMPKSYLEEMLTLNLETASDLQLSDGEEEQEEQEEEEEEEIKEKENKENKENQKNEEEGSINNEERHFEHDDKDEYEDQEQNGDIIEEQDDGEWSESDDGEWSEQDDGEWSEQDDDDQDDQQNDDNKEQDKDNKPKILENKKYTNNLNDISQKQQRQANQLNERQNQDELK